MAKKEATGTKKRFKLSKKWIAAIAVVASIALLIVGGVVISAVTKNPGVKVFENYIGAAGSQDVKAMAETFYEKGSTDYNNFVERYDKGKSQYGEFAKSSSQTEMDTYLSIPENTVNVDDRKDYGLRLEWEKNLAKNIKSHKAYVLYSDSYLIRVNVKITYRDTYSSSSLPGKYSSVSNKMPTDLVLNFKRVGNKWYFDAAFRLFNGQAIAQTWFAPYADGGTEVKKMDPYTISETVDLTKIKDAAGNEITDIRSIGSQAFLNCDKLVKLIIPDELKNIGSEAFNGCKNLVEIVYKDGTSVTADKEIKVGEAAFFNCNKLTGFELSAVNKIVPNYVFYDCFALSGEIVKDGNVIRKNEYKLADSTTAIGFYAFKGCGLLTDIPLPAQLVSIGDGAFENCSALIGLEADRLQKQTIENALSEKITRIGVNAFKNSGLRIVKMSDSVTEIPLGLFNGCSKLTEIRLPAALKTIGAFAFRDVGLSTISLPATLESIGNNAFIFSDIAEVIWERNNAGGTSIRTLGEYSFYSCESIVSLSLPESIRGIGKSAFINCSSLRSVMIDFPADVVVPGAGTENGEIFSMSSGIPKIYVKDGLTAFVNNWYSMRLDIYSQNIINGDFATVNESRTDASGNVINEKVLIQYLGAAEDVALPADITRIGNGAFSYSKQLKSISNFAQLNLTDIGRDVFAGCGKMVFDVYGDARVGTLKYLGGWLIDGSDIADVLDLTDRDRHTKTNGDELVDTVGIAASAFEATDLISVTFNKQLKYICESAFPRLLNFVSVEFETGSQLLRIGADAFSNSAIDHIELPATLKEIDARAFNGCDSLRYVIINSAQPLKLGGEAAVGTDGVARFPQGEDMFYIGYDVLKVYVNNYNTDGYYKNNNNWKAYKDVLYDDLVIDVTRNFAAAETDRIVKDAQGNETIVKEMTFIQLFSIGLADFSIPAAYGGKTVERIGAGAFAKSTVQTVVIHSGIRRIEQYAFYESKMLYSVTFDAKQSGGVWTDSLLYIGTHAFRDTDELSSSTNLSSKIVFKADAPNAGLTFGVEPFDSSLYRKVFVDVRAKYEENKYWKDNRDMLDADDDPWLKIDIEFVIIVDGVQQVITDVDSNKNSITPAPGTIDRAPNDYLDIEATDDIANGYSFVGWYNENGVYRSGSVIERPQYGAANTNSTYIARFAREKAWVKVAIDELARGGNIYHDNKKVSVEDFSNNYYRGGVLVECNEIFTIKAEPYVEYEFEGWYINNVRIGSNPELTYTEMGYRDIEIEARFVKVKAWAILTLQTDSKIGKVELVEGTYISANVITNSTDIRVLLAPGETVSFKATPNTTNYYKIEGWYENGDRNNAAGDDSVFVFTMNANMRDITVRAAFTKMEAEVNLVFNLDGSGVIEESGIVYWGNTRYEDDVQVYIPHGTSFNFVAEGKPGYKFVEWRITIGSNAVITLTDKSLTEEIKNLDVITIEVVFRQAEDVSVSVKFEVGGTVTLNGTAITSDEANLIKYNQDITLKATVSAGYWFAGWYNVNNNQLISDKTEIKVKINDEAVTTRFEARFKLIEAATLTVNLNTSAWNDGGEWGKVSYREGNGLLQAYSAPISTQTGNKIYLTAQFTPETHVFQGWFVNGNRVSTADTYEYLVNNAGAQSVEARFQKKVLLTIKSDSNMGDVTGGKEGITGETVTLTATPKETYAFEGWYLDGVLVSAESSYAVTLTGTIEYEARFIKA